MDYFLAEIASTSKNNFIEITDILKNFCYPTNSLKFVDITESNYIIFIQIFIKKSMALSPGVFNKYLVNINPFETKYYFANFN